jgi:hypothetical protein
LQKKVKEPQPKPPFYPSPQTHPPKNLKIWTLIPSSSFFHILIPTQKTMQVRTEEPRLSSFVAAVFFGSQDLGVRTWVFGSQDLGFRSQHGRISMAQTINGSKRPVRRTRFCRGTSSDAQTHRHNNKTKTLSVDDGSLGWKKKNPYLSTMAV